MKRQVMRVVPVEKTTRTCALSAFVFFLCLLTAGSSFSALALDMTFKAKLTQTTCTMSFMPGSSINMGDNLDGDALIGKDYLDVGRAQFTLHLTNCNIWSSDAAKQMPGIKLTGPLLGPGNYIFRNPGDTGGTSQGFGVVVYNNDGEPKPQGSGGNQMSNGSFFSKIPDQAAVMAGNYAMPLWAGVACGKPANCTAENLKTGTLSAAVTFEFLYH